MMAGRKGNRSDYVVVRSEAAFDPSFENHTADGDGVFNSKREAREWAARQNGEHGRRLVVDPDGGIPSGNQADRAHLLQEQREFDHRSDEAKARRADAFEKRLRDRRDS